MNARIVKAFDVFDKRRQAERTYGIESGMKKQPQIRHPPKRPVLKSILSVKAHPFQPGGVPDGANVSVESSTGARKEEMPLETHDSAEDGKWAAKRAWLLDQAANQSPAEKQAFSEKHKGNALADIVGWMDEITHVKIDGDGRRVVQLPSYVEEKRSLILATMSVPTRWQILIDTCAEVVLIGTKVPHLKIGPSNVVVKGVGNELTAALYQAAFYVLRTDGVILECVKAHVITTIPEDSIVWGWYAILADNKTAKLSLSGKEELLWIQNDPNLPYRQAFNLGRMGKNLVEMTDRVKVMPGYPPPRAVQETFAQILSMPAETINGVKAYTVNMITGPTVDKLPPLPPAPNVAYAMWVQPETVMESARAAPTAECPPPAAECSVTQVNAASWSSNRRVKQVAEDRRAAAVIAEEVSAKHAAKRRAHGRVFVKDRDVCADEMSVPGAQLATAAPENEKKAEAMNENKKIKTEAKELTAQPTIAAPMQQSEVPAQQTQVQEASVQEKALDEHALKEYFVMSVHQALEQAGTQLPIAKLRLKSIDELHKMVIADWKAMKSLFMLCFEQPEPEALILVDESRMQALSLEELLACAVKVRDYKKRKRQMSIIKRPTGGSVFVDAAGKMNVIWYHRLRDGLAEKTPCLAWQEAVAYENERWLNTHLASVRA